MPIVVWYALSALEVLLGKAQTNLVRKIVDFRQATFCSHTRLELEHKFLYRFFKFVNN